MNKMKFYLVLTGEGEKHPRSKKVLQLVKKDIKKGKNFKIIISGFSSFNLDAKVSEASVIQDFFIKNGISKIDIILEENSMDTLGNMVFSCDILQRLIKKFDENVEIILVTEKFHMNRSKKLFLKVCGWLSNQNLNISFKFISAQTFGLPNFYLKRQALKLFNDIKCIFYSLNFERDLFKFIKDDKKVLQKDILDFLIWEVLEHDFNHFKLYNFKDFKDYLFNMPIYNQKFKPTKKYKINESFYGQLINFHLKYLKK